MSQALGNHASIVRELADSRERLTGLLHAVGHDIRTPLVGIDATMQLLAIDADSLSEAELRARVAETARSVRIASGFGLSMIGELFDLIRCDYGKWTPSPSAVDVAALCAEVAAIVEPQARAKSISIEVRLEGCTATEIATVWVDAGRLKQSLVNVVANAVKFGSAGAVEIIVSTPSAEQIRIAVRDRGPGLDEESLVRIFEPFHQSTRTASQAGEGLGLGLAIAERCARLIGGAWTAGNRTDGVGAEFILSLPRRSVPQAVRDEGGASLRATQERPKARVLLVDDATDASRLAIHHLGALGHSVTAATSVREALELLQAERFDLVLADYELGDGTARDLISRAGTTPVAISSARLGSPAESEGAAAVVPKPVTRGSLQAAIERVLGAFPASTKPSK